MAVLGSNYYMPQWSYDPDAVLGDFKSWAAQKKNKEFGYHDSDMVNAYNTERSNYMNMLQWQATNTWNKYMWDLENEYNAPSAQVERLMTAGINPLWSMQSGDTGNAQQLTAQQPHPVTPPQFLLKSRELDQQNAQFAQTNALNSMLGLGDLDIKNRNQLMQERLSKSEIQKTQAEVQLIKSQTETNEFVNRVNSETYGVQVNQKIAELNNARQTLRNLEAQEELSDAQKELLEVTKEKEELLKNQVVAATRKIEQDILNDLTRLSYEAIQLQINQQTANAASTQAAASMQQAQTADAALHHQIEKDTKEFEFKTNEQILQVLESTRSYWDKLIGNPGNFMENNSPTGALINKALSQVRAGVQVLYNRFYDDPTKANADAIDRANRLIQDLTNKVQSTPLPVPMVTPANTSVVNPSSSWSQ